MTTRHERRATWCRRLEAAAVVGAVLLTVGLGRLVPAGVADAADDRTGTAGVSSDVDSRPGDDGSGADPDGGHGALALPRSTPERLRIPGTGTDAAVFTADTAVDGGPPVPSKARAARVAWARSGPAPGERGPALLVGRLDGTARGDAKEAKEAKEAKDAEGKGDGKGDGKRGGKGAALAGLEDLRPGERIEVVRADGRTVHFEADRVERYAQVRYPDKRVYGPTADPQLRLVAEAAPAEKGEPARLGIVVSAHMVLDDP
ncbi:hypothetical protein [Streptomyces sp. NPDC054784]